MLQNNLVCWSNVDPMSLVKRQDLCGWSPEISISDKQISDFFTHTKNQNKGLISLLLHSEV